MAVVAMNHIDVDDQGVARVAGKRTKVIQIVMDKLANGWDAEEIHRHHPHLSLAQIHAAFVYYYEHRAELDEQIRQDLKNADDARAQAGETAAERKLRAMGHLP